jgi:hypothetical protein
MRWRAWSSAVALLLLVPLPLPAAELVLDLRTDYAPRADFNLVRVQLLDRSDERRSWHTITSVSAGDFLAGERVAEFDDVDRGLYLISVELLDDRMRAVDGRIWLLDMGPRAFATILVVARP